MNRSCFIVVWTAVICFLACKKEEVRPLQISENNAEPRLEAITILDDAGDTARSYQLSYDVGSDLPMLIQETHFIDGRRHFTYQVTYKYENAKIAYKTWRGYMNKGIHGTNIYSKTTFDYAYSQSRLQSVMMLDSSSYGEQEKAIRKALDSIIISSNKQTHDDTLFTRVAENFWKELWNNKYFKYRYKRHSNGGLLVEDNHQRVMIETEPSAAQTQLLMEIKLMLYHFYQSGGKVLKSDKAGFLRSQTYSYFDPLVEAVFNSLPVAYNGVEYSYYVNAFGSILSIEVSTGYQIQFHYQSKRKVLL